MRYETLTNMTNKDDRKAADVLLYITRCAKAVAAIPVPEGMKLNFSLEPLVTKATKIIKRAREIHDDLTAELAKVDASVENASRKKTKAK